jgi:hypothetical protein
MTNKNVFSCIWKLDRKRSGHNNKWGIIWGKIVGSGRDKRDGMVWRMWFIVSMKSSL